MPKWTRMPGSVRLKLDHAILQHLRTHGPRFYDLLRDDAQFAPWIGAHLGARGEKRLDRYIKVLRLNQPRKIRGDSERVSNERHDLADQVSPGPPPANAEIGLPHILDGGVPATSYAELQAGLRAQRAWIVQAIKGCSNEYGEVTDKPFFLRLNRELRDVDRASADLTKRFHADMNSDAFMRRVIDRVLEERAGEPDKARELANDIKQIFHESAGLAANAQER